MNRNLMPALAGLHRPLFLCALALGITAAATAQTRTYTDDADFLEGTLSNLVLTPPDQLQLGTEVLPFPFISVATSGGLGTIVRIDAETGEIIGEYLTAPAGEAQDPSRATVDLMGNTWAGNRAEDAVGLEGSAVQVGIVVGGTRTDATGQPDPNGEYLAPPYDYTTVVDRDGDGLIRTSDGSFVLPWPNITDGDGGIGGTAALVEDSLDEAITIFQKTECPNIRHLSIDGEGEIWVGGYPGFPTCFQRLSSLDGSFISTSLVTFGFCGGYGGLVDSAGTLWSVSALEDALMRYEIADPLPPMSASNCLSAMPNPRGVAADSAGNLWLAGSGEVRVFDALGNQLFAYPITGASFLHGIAVHPADQSVWVADSDQDVVYRLDDSGSLQATISVGVKPNGVAVDGFGKVWVCNEDSGNMMRIDPATDAVEHTTELGADSKPFNPSSMAGTVIQNSTLHDGFWNVIANGGASGTGWFNVSWNDYVPGYSTLEVFVRAADVEADLDGLPWVPVTNGAGIDQVGRFLQVQAEFMKDIMEDWSPILYDLTVEGLNEGPGDCIEVNRRKPASLLIYPEFDNRAGVVSILTLSHVDCDADEDLAVEFVYIDEENCREFNRTEVMTPCDTITLVTGAHNPNQERGYVYAFAKDARTGEPVVANVLIGSLLVVNGLDAFEYGLNPVGFEGLGQNGLTDLDGDGLLDLDDLEYTMAPDAILVPRFIGQTGGNQGFHSELILIALSGGVQFTTTVDFLIYNDAEEEFSGEYSFYCWDKVPLLEISGVFGNDFLRDFTNHDPGEILGAPGREAGWFRIDGGVANSTHHTIYDPAFYAVLVERVGTFGAGDLPFEYCSQDNGSLIPQGVYGD